MRFFSQKKHKRLARSKGGHFDAEIPSRHDIYLILACKTEKQERIIYANHAKAYKAEADVEEGLLKTCW